MISDMAGIGEGRAALVSATGLWLNTANFPQRILGRQSYQAGPRHAPGPREPKRHASETPAADRHPRPHRRLLVAAGDRRKPQRGRAVQASAGAPGQRQLHQRGDLAQGAGVALPVRPLRRAGAARTDLRPLPEPGAGSRQGRRRALHPPASAAPQRRLCLVPQGPGFLRPGPRPAGPLPAAGHDQARSRRGPRLVQRIRPTGRPLPEQPLRPGRQGAHDLPAQPAGRL
ncbi:hypothetical protein D3C75_860760 [compost metagenome]